MVSIVTSFPSVPPESDPGRAGASATTRAQGR
jgi:hypothetical protein